MENLENNEEASLEIRNRRRKRAIKVFFTEGLMVLAVILLVIITTFIATGYNIKPGEDWTIERTGLVQIQTKPTGANITIDGESIFGWTNMSRSMTEGKHEIVLSRDGYESWEKEISVTPGLYYRLSYPRLFLEDKKIETLETIPENGRISFAKDGNTALLYFGDGITWRVFEVNNDKLKSKDIDLKDFFSKTTAGDESKTEVVGWSGNSERVLVFRNGEWVLVNVKQPEKSFNLTKKFSADFSEVKIANDSANVLYVVLDGNLRRIDVNEEKMSSVLVSRIKVFDNIKSDVVFVADDDGDGEFEYGFLKDGEKTISSIVWHQAEDGKGIDIDDEIVEKDEFFKADQVEKISVSEYYGNYYLNLVSNKNEWIIVEADRVFNSGSKFRIVYYEEFEKPIDDLEVRGDGELFAVSLSDEQGIFDVETENVVKITTFLDAKWLDEHMIYDISPEGELNVADFDRKNERKITDKVKIGTEVKISKNYRWMYFVSEDNKLSRAVIAD